LPEEVHNDSPLLHLSLWLASATGVIPLKIT